MNIDCVHVRPDIEIRRSEGDGRRMGGGESGGTTMTIGHRYNGGEVTAHGRCGLRGEPSHLVSTAGRYCEFGAFGPLRRCPRRPRHRPLGTAGATAGPVARGWRRGPWRRCKAPWRWPRHGNEPLGGGVGAHKHKQAHNPQL